MRLDWAIALMHLAAKQWDSTRLTHSLRLSVTPIHYSDNGRRGLNHRSAALQFTNTL
ncbi:hypothetical protein [Leptolyngbya sp. O-77]|uniref:hypothetical protein n=1 Tax=Leptolyngbya sp. O-77 TaxID=1080068 RepID=UPI0012E37B23|nr:hypothetical protein [Leptolyngbya sp. O-77]